MTSHPTVLGHLAAAALLCGCVVPPRAVPWEATDAPPPDVGPLAVEAARLHFSVPSETGETVDFLDGAGRSGTGDVCFAGSVGATIVSTLLAGVPPSSMFVSCYDTDGPTATFAVDGSGLVDAHLAAAPDGTLVLVLSAAAGSAAPLRVVRLDASLAPISDVEVPIDPFGLTTAPDTEALFVNDRFVVVGGLTGLQPALIVLDVADLAVRHVWLGSGGPASRIRGVSGDAERALVAVDGDVFAVGEEDWFVEVRLPDVGVGRVGGRPDIARDGTPRFSESLSVFSGADGPLTSWRTELDVSLEVPRDDTWASWRPCVRAIDSSGDAAVLDATALDGRVFALYAAALTISIRDRCEVLAAFGGGGPGQWDGAEHLAASPGGLIGLVATTYVESAASRVGRPTIVIFDQL